MQYKLPRTKGIFIEKDILASEAYWSLNGTAIKVYMIFLMKRVMKKSKSGNGMSIINNGKIQFTFKEAQINYHIPKSSFLRARDLLIEVGMIKIKENGGEHHPTLYAISEDWKKYPEQKFVRPKSANLVGKNTRFKSKDTSNNDTI
jgi:hypothetical protein